MRVRLGYGLSTRQLASGSLPLAAPFTTVLGPNDGQFGPWVGDSQYEGWAVRYAAQPTIAVPVPFDADRLGWDATATAVTHRDRLYTTAVIRQPAPNDAIQSDFDAAMSDYLYINDALFGGAINNSTLVSPKPICKWVLPSRRTVGNSVTVQVVASHRNARNGKQVACVVFTATSLGTGSATVTTATPKILGYTNDRLPVIGYEAVINLTGLSDNTAFTVDAIAYPWIGSTSASQRRSIDGTAANYWDFSTQTYLKNTSKAANPPLVYVNSATGIDAVVDVNGVFAAITKVSTSHAVASMAPFATVTAALNALKAASNITGGFTDGCQVRIQNSTVPMAAPTTGTYQSVSEVIFTRDPDFARSACILQFGATAAVTTQQNWIKFTDLTVNRVGAFVLNFTNQLVIENNTFDNASQGGVITSNAARTIHLIGNTVTNWASGVLSGAASAPAGVIRGNTMSGGTIEGNCLIGNRLTTTTTTALAARVNNSYIGHNSGINIGALWVGITGMDVVGFAIIQNILEWTSAVANPLSRYNADAAANNTEHVISFNNSYVGVHIYGRHNNFYDEGGTARRHKLNAIKNDFITQFNTKSDYVQYYNNANPEAYTTISPSRRLGNWAIYYGVGCEANWINYKVNSTAGEAQTYAGRGSSVGASITVPLMANARFTAYAAAFYNGASYVAGAGSGTYSLTGSAEIKAAALNAYLPFDSAGTVRPLTGDSIGAYV